MKQQGDTKGGWTWWLKEWKASHPDSALTMKELLQKYIKGEKPE